MSVSFESFDIPFCVRGVEFKFMEVVLATLALKVPQREDKSQTVHSLPDTGIE